MSARRRKQRLGSFLLLALCACAPAFEVSPEGETAGETPVPALEPGLTIRLAPTVLGLGASVANWTGKDGGLRTVSVVEVGAESLLVEWNETVREETEDSRRRRRAFEDDPPHTGVGEPEPEAPKPEYAERQKRGRLAAAAWRDSREMNLPKLWPEGEQEVARGSLLWMPPEAYRELRQTRQTQWRPGLVGLDPASAVAELGRGLDALRQRMEGSESERRSYDSIEAEADFGSFELEIGGRTTEVQTIVAHNWFARYVILDNEENPLILEVTLNPLSAGALDVFSPLGVLKSLLGYQVVAMEAAG